MSFHPNDVVKRGRAANWIVGCNLPISLPQLLVKTQPLLLEPVGDGGSASLDGALQANRDRHIENERKVGFQIANRHTFHCAEQLRIDFAEFALIDARRIREPVAQHPRPRFKRRLDNLIDVVIARGRKQQ